MRTSLRQILEQKLPVLLILYCIPPALLSVFFHAVLRKSSCDVFSDSTLCQQQECLYITELGSSQNIITSLSLTPTVSLAVFVPLRLVLCVSSMELPAF